MKKEEIAILGGGCWGVTLACHLKKKGYPVAIWEYEPNKVERLNRQRKLSFLPGLKIPKEIIINSNLSKVLENKKIIIFALPSKFFRSVAKKIGDLISDKVKLLIIGTKGLENNTFKRMSEILEEELPKKLHKKIAVLSGPSFAQEVSQSIPTAVTVASKNKETMLAAQELLFTPCFRVYTNPDITGVELAGALKNIYAIACGVSDGLGLGDNTKAALVTRGLAEMIRLGIKLGAQLNTFYGLAGIGDLMVTCFSRWSRNRALGEKIGQGEDVEQALKEIKMTVEGLETTKVTYFLAQKMKVEMPIVREAYSLLYEGKRPDAAMQNLLMRKAKGE